MSHSDDKGAVLSTCGAFRYRLWRWWDREAEPLVFVMLNPSTADASIDDPTIRRCKGFAERMGFGGIEVVNLYAFRSKSPAELKQRRYPDGPENWATLRAVFKHTRGQVVAAWGTHAQPNRALDVRWLALECARPLYTLRRTKEGCPAHPLYLPGDCVLREWVL